VRNSSFFDRSTTHTLRWVFARSCCWTEVDFTIILRAAFALFFFGHNSTNPNLKAQKKLRKTISYNKLHLKRW